MYRPACACVTCGVAESLECGTTSLEEFDYNRVRSMSRSTMSADAEAAGPMELANCLSSVSGLRGGAGRGEEKCTFSVLCTECSRLHSNAYVWPITFLAYSQTIEPETA